MGSQNNFEIIKAATLQKAKLLNIDKEYGSIEIGKKADLLITSKDPKIDLKNLSKIVSVFKLGQPVAQYKYKKYKNLDTLLDK